MVNPDSVKLFMTYIDESLSYRKSGEVIPIKVRDAIARLEALGIGQKESLDAYNFIKAYKFIVFSDKQPVPDIKQTFKIPASQPKAQTITGFTYCGYEFLKAVNQNVFWEKIKDGKLFETAASMISLLHNLKWLKH